MIKKKKLWSSHWIREICGYIWGLDYFSQQAKDMVQNFALFIHALT